MKNQKLNHVLFWIIVFTFSIFLNSCRSVKKDKTVVKESLITEIAIKEHKKEKEESNIKEVVETKTNSTTGTTTKKTITKPIDPTKPATKTDSKGNKTTLENAELVEEETTIDNTMTTNQKSTLEAQKQKVLERNAAETKKRLEEIDQEILKVERSFPTTRVIVTLLAIIIVVSLVCSNRLRILKWFKGIWWIKKTKEL